MAAVRDQASLTSCLGGDQSFAAFRPRLAASLLFTYLSSGLNPCLVTDGYIQACT